MRKIFTIAILALSINAFAQSICVNDAFLSITNAPTSDVFRTVSYGNDIYTFGAQNSKYSTTGNSWSSFLNTPTIRAESGVAEVNGIIYCIGGWTGSPSNKNEAYNISTNTWSTRTNLPTALTGCFAVSLNNKVYIIGGTLGTTTTYFYEYNPVSNTYSNLTAPSQNRMHAGLVAYNNKIYLIGGYYYNGSYNTSNKLDEYDPSSNTWTSKANIPVNIQTANGTIYDNKLYLFGGTSAVGTITPLNSFYVYDFVSNTWTTMANMPFSRASLDPKTVNGSVYLIGGHINATITTNLSYQYYCIFCSTNTAITPQSNALNTGSTATFTATTSDPNPSYVWQSDFGQGFQALNNFGNYSGANTATLNIANVQLSSHTQPIRVISTSGNCIDTSNVAVINILDTCSVTVYDTLLTTVTDTLVINAQITGINPPNNLNTLKVFPNPASSHITIDYGNFNVMSGYTLTIVNSIGQTVFTTPINQQSSYIDLSTWTGNGIYYVLLIDAQNNTIENRKIVIQ